MIEVSNLHKRFGPVTAVDGISFRVVPGEILGFLGPNGAGKSTTMKMITGFLTPSEGTATIWGADILTDRLTAQQHIGYLPEGTPAYDEMTPASFLDFIAEIRGFDRATRAGRVAEVAATMALEDVLHQRIETLSKGYKRRVGLAQAIIHDPDLLILDEPTDGLDPNQKHQVREMIRGLSRDKIVIISTHILEEVTAVCTRAMIINHGRVVSDCTPRELECKSKYHNAITLHFADGEDIDAALAAVRDLPGVGDVEQQTHELVLIPREPEGGLLTEVTHLVNDRNWQLTGMFQERGRLDEVFRNVTAEV